MAPRTVQRWVRSFQEHGEAGLVSRKDYGASGPGQQVDQRWTKTALDSVTLRSINSELTVAMDWYDRCIVGLRLTPVSTKSVDAASVLYQLYRPRPAGRDWRGIVGTRGLA